MNLAGSWAQRRSFFETHGYLVLDGFASPQDVSSLRARARVLSQTYRRSPPVIWGAPESEAVLDASASGIEVFHASEAHRHRGSSPGCAFSGAIKIGHALHDLDPVFDNFSRRADFAELLSALGCMAPRLVQSMYLPKSPGLVDVVDWHQDASFLYTEPQWVLGLWLALHETTTENGCLWIQPGSHTTGIARRWARQVDGGCGYLEVSSPPVHAAGVPLTVAAGTLVVLHGCVFHRSGSNESEEDREAYVLHVMDGRGSYAPDNWLQRAGDKPFRGY